jgi:putative ABC transport system permease protein
MRQRSLSTWLTLLSVLLGVTLAIAILILYRESGALFAQSDFGYELIIGPPKGSPLTMVMNVVYHYQTSPGNVPYSLFQEMSSKKRIPGKPFFAPMVRLAVPFMFGDSYVGQPIVGTSPVMFGLDPEGKMPTGWDANGNLLPGYQDPNVPEDERDENKPTAGARFQYRLGKTFEFAQGRCFAPRKFESVVGSTMADRYHMHVGTTFQATHGFPAPTQTPDIHKPVWTVVGILKPTHTANDKTVFVPFVSLFAIAEHEIGLIDQAMMKANFDYTVATPAQIRDFMTNHGFSVDTMDQSLKRHYRLISDTPASKPAELIKPSPSTDLMTDIKPAAPPKPTAAAPAGDEAPAYHLDANGDIVPELPPEQWELSAILVKTRGALAATQLLYNFKLVNTQASAAVPAVEMRNFFDNFLKGSTLILLVISIMVTIVAGVGILVSIYNSVAARTREIAILRALGATRGRVLGLICMEAGLIGLAGGLLGLCLGHAVGYVESHYFNQTLGSTINWMHVDHWELLYILSVVVLAVLAGLVPALKAYRTPVATNLTAV